MMNRSEIRLDEATWSYYVRGLIVKIDPWKIEQKLGRVRDELKSLTLRKWGNLSQWKGRKVLMVGDKKWEGGRKIMRNPCLSCLLNNTDKHEYIRSRMKFNFLRWKMGIKIVRRRKFHQIILLLFIPFTIFHVSPYTFRLKFNNIWWKYQICGFEFIASQWNCSRQLSPSIPLFPFSFDCFQATISSSPPMNKSLKKKHLFDAILCQAITYARG